MNWKLTPNAPNYILQNIFLPFFLLFLKNEMVCGQSEAATKPLSIFEEMMVAKSNKITLETDIDALIANKMKADYQPAHLVLGKKIDQNIEIRPRGKFRRKVCDFPPIKIKFSKKQLRQIGLDTLNQMKLVTHCADSEDADRLLAREFLAYKLYEIITPISFKTRLVTVNYVDSKNKKRRFSRLGILLEDDNELAERLGGTVEEDIYNLPADSLNANQAAINALFEYMIGNTDWSIEGVRNIKFLRPNSSGKLVPVPYDFDFSGLVNASYASPNSDFPLKSVRDRHFMGKNLPEETVKRAAKSFHKNESNFYQVIQSADYLTEIDKEDLHLFLRSFFHQMTEMNDVPVNKVKVADR
jgi:hypothetical protein